MGSSSTLAPFLMLLFLTSIHAITEESISLLPMTTVTIVNQLAGPVLGVHCRSKNDDLGVQILESEKSYSFTFRPNVFGTTLFYCTFEWVKGEVHNFNIYDFRRDEKHCTDCRWLVYRDGPCLMHPKDTGTYNICSPWN